MLVAFGEDDREREEGGNIQACAKTCFAWTLYVLYINTSSGLNFLCTNLTLSERVCIKEIMKINLMPRDSFYLTKLNMKIYTKSWLEIGRGRVDTSSTSLEFDFLFASFPFRQFSFCCLT